MTESPSGAILLVPQDGSAGLSPSQRSFNALTRQVAARRERLRAWETVWPPFQQRYVDEWVPLARELSARETELVRQLDVAAEMKGLSRAERELVSQLIVHFARPLLGADADRELRAILARHGAAAMGQAAGDAGRRGGKSRRRDAAPAEDAAPGHAAAEPPEDESEEAMMLRIQAELDAQEARASADAQARQAQRGERQRASSSKRKAAEAAAAEAARAAAQAQQESPAEAEADRTDTEAVPEMAPAQVSRSLRDLYRRLASALHPDREPDADERERKTALMQRLNRAYDKQDLLQLLELERDLGAADADRLAGAGDELLRHYNGILKAQLASLDRELHRVEADFRHGYGIGANAVLSPDTALRTLGEDIAGLRRALAELERDLLALREIGALKDWLAGFVG